MAAKGSKIGMIRSAGTLSLFIALLLLLLIPAAFAAQEADLSLEMGASVHVSADPFALSEIAALTGRDDLVRRVGAVSLSLPGDGILTREHILEALSAHGIGGLRLALIMPASVEVRLDDSLSGIIKRLSGWPWHVEAEPMGLVPSGMPLSPPSIAPGTGSVTLKYDDGAGGERSVAVKLSWQRPAVVAARPVERGKVLTEEDLAVRTVKVMRSTPLASAPEEVLGKTVRRNLSAGEPVALNLLAASPIIQRGDSVIIMLRTPGFLIEVRGQALDGGVEGDLIRVRNLQSKKVIQALVVSPGRVEVQ